VASSRKSTTWASKSASRSVGIGFAFKIRVLCGWAGIIRHGAEGFGERAQRPFARPQRDHVPHCGPTLLAQRRKQPGEDERRLATARGADHGDKFMLLYAHDKLADGVIAAAEEGRVLFAERLQAPVRADRRPDGGGGESLAAQQGVKLGEVVGLLKNACAFAEIDPGEELKEPGRRGVAAWHQDEDYRERGVRGLPNEREFALILLGIAKPVLAYQDGHGLRAADCLFQRRKPPKARAKRSAVEEGSEALGAKPAIQLSRGNFIAAGVAEKDVVGVAAAHGDMVIRFVWMVNPARGKPLLKPRPNLLLFLLLSDTFADPVVEPFRHARPRQPEIVVEGRQRADKFMSAASLSARH